MYARGDVGVLRVVRMEAFINAGALRKDLPKGNVPLADLMDSFPLHGPRDSKHPGNRHTVL